MKNRNFKIACATVDDIENILALQETVAENMNIKEWFVPSTKTELDLAFSSPEKFPALKIICESELVAFSYIILNPDESNDISSDIKTKKLENCCVYETVFVSPQYRGYGFQNKLISMLTDIAKQSGKSNIIATVHPDNTFSSLNFIKNGYKKLNDTPIPKYGSVRDYYAKSLT